MPGMKARVPYSPALKNKAVRLALGLGMAFAAAYMTTNGSAESFLFMFAPLLISWAVSVWATDKYAH
jgi:hypothetical protein